MKLLVLTALVIVAAVGATNLQESSGPYKGSALKVKEVERRGLRHSIKSLAKKVTKFTVKALEDIYKVAKKTAEKVVHSQAFEKAVDIVIGQIDTAFTEMECSLSCAGLVIDVPGIGEVLAPIACPAVCKAALSKLAEGAKLLAEKIES